VTIVGITPDIDGLGYFAEVLTENSPMPLHWYSEYHHVFGHNIGFALLVSALVFVGTRRSWKATIMALVGVHVHFLCDVMGSRGPDNWQWPIPYFLPFSGEWQWTWDGQWELDAWQNKVIGLAFFWATFVLAWWRGFSPFGLVSERADKAFVGLLRRCFPRAAKPPGG
jgi:membrane-bound metal-dependent hydrolase YbcI (DUF457 family)